jgi:MoaA/NifB/PqqE/SkfB family radical SAM enzyme
MYDTRVILYQGDRPEYRFIEAGFRLGVNGFADPAEINGQLDRVDPNECRRLIFAGSNPMAHPDFLGFVDRCAERGVQGLAIEAPANALVNDAVVEYLADKEFREAFLTIASLEEAVHDAIMGEPGTLQDYMKGIQNAVDRGIKTYVVVPVLQANMGSVEALIVWLSKLKPRVTGVLFSVPLVGEVPVEHRHKVLSMRDMAPWLTHYFQVAQRRRLEYGLAEKHGIAPCAAGGLLDRYGSVFHDRINHYKHSKRIELTEVTACSSCVLRENCPGVEVDYAQHYGDQEFTPIGLDEALGWRLRPLNKLDQWEYNQVSSFDNPVTSREMSLVRINGHCNMACSFCFVDRTVGDSDIADVVQEIRTFVDEGTKHLIISGGEPTIHPRLADIIRSARDMGVNSIEMQSNGVRAADLDYAKTLVDAGVTLVTFSLHSVDPETSDEITRLPKAFWKTVQAMHNFRKLGVRVQIACVITKVNFKELPEYVRFIRTEFPEDEGHLSICFAIAQGISDLVAKWVVPTFSEIRPYFKNALDFCLDSNLGYGGIIGQGGYPPCMLDGEYRYYDQLMDKIYRSPGEQRDFYKSEACSDCSFNEYCVGVRRAYIDQYGDAEITPISREVPENMLSVMT